MNPIIKNVTIDDQSSWILSVSVGIMSKALPQQPLIYLVFFSIP